MSELLLKKLEEVCDTLQTTQAYKDIIQLVEDITGKKVKTIQACVKILDTTTNFGDSNAKPDVYFFGNIFTILKAHDTSADAIEAIFEGTRVFKDYGTTGTGYTGKDYFPINWYNILFNQLSLTDASSEATATFQGYSIRFN